MLSRVVTVIAALLLAVSPAVRALCDAGCLAPVSAGAAAVGAAAPHGEHCAPPVQSRERPADECGHDHVAAGPVLLVAKTAVTGPVTLAPLSAMPWPPAGPPAPLPVLFAPPDLPALTRPVPLRL